MRILTRFDHAHHAGNTGQVRAGVLVDGGLDRCLHLWVQGGADQVPARGDLLLADPGPRQVLLDVVAEECAVAGRDAAARQLIGLRQYPQRLGLGGTQRLRLPGKVLDHGVEDHVPPGQRAVGVGVRVERAGRLHHAGQQRRLLPIQVGRVDAEVRLRRVLHAERVIAERDQVQVSGQDFRFCEGLVQRECHPDLAKLAGRSGFDGRSLLGIGLGCHQQLVVLHVLLFERRAAARVEVAGRVARQAGQGALPVHAAVVGEPLIFNRDDRQLHRVGDLVRGHLEPALRVQPRDRVALRVDHRRYRRHLPLEQLGRAVGNDLRGTIGHQP